MDLQSLAVGDRVEHSNSDLPKHRIPERLLTCFIRLK